MLILSVLVARPPTVAPHVGRYRLKPSEEMVRFCRLLGRAAPVSLLALLEDGTFDLQGDGGTRHGRYEIVDGKLTLKVAEGTLLHGERKADTIALEGFVFERAPDVPSGVCGRWTVRRNGQEDRSILMDLRRDGTFRFVMAGASSEGTWTCAAGKLSLAWTKIDNDAVAAGTVRKEIDFTDKAESLQIDTYRYERATTDK